MTQQLEDRLRAAFGEKADQIPAVAPPLRLASQPGRARGFGGWLTPGHRKLAAGLAAAAAIAGVAVVTVVAASPTAPPTHLPAGPAAKPPPYYVAIAGAAAVVRATGTGAVIANIRVPHPYTGFGGVTGAADDRTFVLQAVTFANAAVPEKLYLLRIGPGARLAADHARLTPLDVRLPSGTGVLGMALSPDGKSLAIVETHGTKATNLIVIYNLVTRGSRTWRLHGCRGDCNIGANMVGPIQMNTISWTDDGHRLGFVRQSGPTGLVSQFRLLNIRAAGDDVLADSQPVRLVATPGVLKGVAPDHAIWGVALITPDGGSLIIDATNAYDGQPSVQNLLRYSTRSGALQTAVGAQPNGVARHEENVLWTSPDGSTVLVTGFRGQHSAGLLHDGRYTPIPWSAQLLSAAW